ncbi:MAG: S-methyl-5-thioribose-1-phosphate isomerase [Thermoproteota archaeon]|nr:MAG: S-methyl-5-thioribose-1-phosphate isomerase [Candidatus Korarchaeota archaeon]
MRILPRTVRWEDGRVILIDQTKLPEELTFIECEDVECVARAIEEMKVRGAPAIGATAAYGLALVAHHFRARDESKFLSELEKAAERLRRTRPTAVNLFWAIERVMKAAKAESNLESMKRRVIEEALRIGEEDVESNRRIGEHGQELIQDGQTIMTICNAGSLATVHLGTVLAPIYLAWEKGKKIRVIALETRPVLQGARLTAFELHYAGIPVTLIVDGASGYVMKEVGVDLVLVGADRILSDGTVYNKIGTYNLAIIAKEHNVPFYSVAPTSTFDLKSRREDVIIEQRNPAEVREIKGVKIAPSGVNVLNPAFDMTPPEYLTGILTEKGILRPPFKKSIAKLFDL